MVVTIIALGKGFDYNGPNGEKLCGGAGCLLLKLKCFFWYCWTSASTFHSAFLAALVILWVFGCHWLSRVAWFGCMTWLSAIMCFGWCAKTSETSWWTSTIHMGLMPKSFLKSTATPSWLTVWPWDLLWGSNGQALWTRKCSGHIHRPSKCNGMDAHCQDSVIQACLGQVFNFAWLANVMNVLSCCVMSWILCCHELGNVASSVLVSQCSHCCIVAFILGARSSVTSWSSGARWWMQLQGIETC